MSESSGWRRLGCLRALAGTRMTRMTRTCIMTYYDDSEISHDSDRADDAASAVPRTPGVDDADSEIRDDSDDSEIRDDSDVSHGPHHWWRHGAARKTRTSTTARTLVMTRTSVMTQRPVIGNDGASVTARTSELTRTGGGMARESVTAGATLRSAAQLGSHMTPHDSDTRAARLGRAA